MRQLPLDLALPDYAQFNTFFAGANAAVLQAAEQAATGNAPVVQWLWGPADSGRSHLLQAAVAEAGRRGRRCAWLPLAEISDPVQLEGMGALDLLCLDDMDAVASLAAWQRPLFLLFEELRQHGACSLVSAAAAPAETGFILPDLASRMASGPIWRVRALQDEELLDALRLRAEWRGLELPDDTGNYLLRRVSRSPAALFALLDRLDQAALAAQRRLTVPLVKAVLDAPELKRTGI